jgi:hydroxypyruvate isomerase
LVVLAGDMVPGSDVAIQQQAMIDALARASDAISSLNVELLLEVVNRQVEGPNALVQDSATAIALLRKLDRPNVRFLYDRYHAILNGEPLGWAVDANIDLVGHIQAADVPGRHEFGSGSHDWSREFAWLLARGYAGYVGIEAMPVGPSQTLHSDARALLPAH